MGRATKKKFHSMRRALSLDRMDKAGTTDEGPKVCYMLDNICVCIEGYRTQYLSKYKKYLYFLWL